VVKEMTDRELQKIYHYLYQLVEVAEVGGVGDLMLYIKAKDEIKHRDLPVLCDALDYALGVVVSE
jgi:hypothetical protein